MSRRCACSRLLAALRDDPRLVTLPLAVRMLFLLLAEAAGRAPEPGVLPFADPRRVALLVSCAPTEAESGMETLETEGLIRREGAGLAVPLVQEAATRSEVARRNGSSGGRPRKGETREQYLARRQGEMILPIAGGAAGKPGETEDAKPADSPPVVVGKRDLPSPSTTPPADARVPEWVSLGAEVAEIAGLDGARGGYDFRPVQAWLNEGIAPAAILAAVRGVVAGRSYEARKVRTLLYFGDAVRREADRAGPPPPAPLTQAERESEAAAMARIQARIQAQLDACGRMQA